MFPIVLRFLLLADEAIIPRKEGDRYIVIFDCSNLPYIQEIGVF